MDLLASSPDKAIKKLLDFSSPPNGGASSLPTREILDSPYKWKPNEPIPESMQPIVLIPPLKISDSPFDLPVPNPDEEPYVDSSDDSSMMDRDENSSLSKSRKRKREVIEEVVDIIDDEGNVYGETFPTPVPSLLSRVKSRRRSAVKQFHVTPGPLWKQVKKEKLGDEDSEHSANENDGPGDESLEIIPLDQATCFLCNEKGNQRCQGGMQEMGIFKLVGKKPIQYFAHENCSFYASKHEDESPEAFLKRTLSYNMPCKYRGCKLKKAALGCSISSCPNIYHYKCAKLAKGELCVINTSVKFYCGSHIGKALDDKIEDVRWPFPSSFPYLFRNNWSGISQQHYIEIQSNKFLWERFQPEWFHRDLGARVSVREIFVGHWAWCEDLASKGSKKKPSKQYEVIAIEDFEEEDFIGEYVGKVIYQKDILDSKYVAMFYFGSSLPQSLRDNPMCIDAQEGGNEMRFINSVSPITPPDITQNATMSTVWCRGELRIVISATRSIAKNEAIVLNYNEYANSFFDEKMTDQDHTKKQHQDCYVWISKADQGPPPNEQNMITAKMNKIIFEEGDIDVSVESHVNSGSDSDTKNTNTKPNSQAITKFFKSPVAWQEKNGAVPRAFNKQSTITSWLKRTPKASSENSNTTNNQNNKSNSSGVVVVD
jgi:hypothetical protein